MSEYKEGETALSSLYKDKCKDLEETILSMDEEATELANKIIELEAENKRLRDALEKIAKGEGAFSRDRLEHATNVIENAIDLAKQALKETE